MENFFSILLSEKSKRNNFFFVKIKNKCKFIGKNINDIVIGCWFWLLLCEKIVSNLDFFFLLVLIY